MRVISILVTGMTLALAAAPVFSQQRDQYIHGHMWNGGGWFLGPILMLLLLAAIVAIMLFLIKHSGGSIPSKLTTYGHHQDTPLEILQLRYAKGEIDHEEFELRRKTLES